MKNWVKRIPTILFAVTGIILLGVMIKILSWGLSEPAAAGPVWVGSSIQQLETSLAAAVNPTEEAFIQGKLDRLRSIQENSLQAQQNAPEKPADICAMRPTPLPTAKRIAGLDQFDPELFEQFNLLVNSRWQGEVNGQWTAVLAGASADDPQLGMLLVLVHNTDVRALITAPQPGGALRIQAADGTRLTLIDDSGVEVLFDIPAHAYLASPDELLPTLAPQPTFTPTAEICPP